MQFDDVETIDECIDVATVDCCDEYEQAWGWFNCLEEVLGNLEYVNVLGEQVRLECLEVDGYQVVAVCKKKDRTVKVTLDSIELFEHTDVQRLWLEAWMNWSDISS